MKVSIFIILLLAQVVFAQDPRYNRFGRREGDRTKSTHAYLPLIQEDHIKWGTFFFANSPDSPESHGAGKFLIHYRGSGSFINFQGKVYGVLADHLISHEGSNAVYPGFEGDLVAGDYEYFRIIPTNDFLDVSYEHDAAIFEVDPKHLDTPFITPFELAKELPKIGEAVRIVGSPNSYGPISLHCTAGGLIHTKYPRENDARSFIQGQLVCPKFPEGISMQGLSGGAVLNSNNKVVGIFSTNSTIPSTKENLQYAPLTQSNLKMTSKGVRFDYSMYLGTIQTEILNNDLGRMQCTFITHPKKGYFLNVSTCTNGKDKRFIKFTKDGKFIEWENLVY